MKSPFAWLLALGAVVVGALVVGFAFLSRTAEPVDEASSGRGSAEGDRAVLAPAQGEPSSSESPDVQVPTRQLIDVSQPAEAEPVAAPMTVPGRVVFSDGEPVAGAQLTLGLTWSYRKPPLPEDWVEPETVSAQDGTFELTFTPPPGYQFRAWAQLPGYVAAHSPAFAGSITEFGDIVLIQAGTVTGHVVNGAGDPVAGTGWVVSMGADESGSVPQVSADVDDRGAFELEGVPPGTRKVRAYHEVVKWVEGPRLDIAAGSVVDVTLVYDGPHPDDTITVTARDSSSHWAKGLFPASIELRGEGEISPPTPLPSSPGSVAFHDLSAGTYTVEIEDDRFEPWRRDGVRPGTEVVAVLHGASAFVLDVRDAATGLAVPDYTVSTTLRSASLVAFDQVMRWHNDAAAKGGRLDGLYPGDYTVSVRAEGYGPVDVEVGALRRGEERVLSVELSQPATLRGRVTGGDAPVPLVDVVLLEPAQIDDSEASPVARKGWPGPRDGRERQEVQRVATDESGKFEMSVGAPGPYVLVVAGNGGQRVQSEPVYVAPGEERHVNLALPAPGRLVGRIVNSGGTLPEGLRVWARPSVASPVWAQMLSPALVDPDGSFELTPLTPGEVTVFLLLPAEQHDFHMRLEDRRPTGAREIGTAAIRAGKTTTEEFPLGDGVPGSLQLTLKNHGTPLDSAIVRVLGGAGLSGTTDARGRVQLSAFAGEWPLSIESTAFGARYAHPDPVLVSPGKETRLELDVRAATASITLLDETTGEPLRGRSVGLIKESLLFASGKRTNDAGRVELTLAPGEYWLILDVGEDQYGLVETPQGTRRQASLAWTPFGPLDEDLRL